MALKTLGTNATTSLTAFIVGVNDVINADLASITTAIKQDPPTWNGVRQGTTRQQLNQAYVKNGVLFIPRRGSLVLVNGDYVCWDATTGWPIVVSADAAASGPYTHT
jgi:hypothetical protein